MKLIYLDESGDNGLMSNNSMTRNFTLAAVAVDSDKWSSALNEMIGFRRFLKRNFGIQMRAEVKANYIIRGTHSFEGMGDDMRDKVFRMMLKLPSKIGLRVWAVVFDKEKYESKVDNPSKEDIFRISWKYMLQRVERLTKTNEDTAMLFPDEGHESVIRGITRRMRVYNKVYSQFNYRETLDRPLKYLIEDPNFRNSDKSYFIQMADIVAYTANHCIHQVDYFPAKYWNLLGDARYSKVSKKGNCVDGIVLYP